MKVQSRARGLFRFYCFKNSTSNTVCNWTELSECLQYVKCCSIYNLYSVLSSVSLFWLHKKQYVLKPLVSHRNAEISAFTHTHSLFAFSTTPWASRVHHSTAKLLQYVVDQHYETSWSDFSQLATVAGKKHVTAILLFSYWISKLRSCFICQREHDDLWSCKPVKAFTNSARITSSTIGKFLLIRAFVWITVLRRDPPRCSPLISCSRQPAWPSQIAAGNQW